MQQIAEKAGIGSRVQRIHFQTGNLHFGDGTSLLAPLTEHAQRSHQESRLVFRHHVASFYQTPKADLIIFVQKRLKNMGLSQEEIVAFALSFSSNTAIPLSLQVTAVKDLEAFGKKALPHRRFPTKIVD
jgi:hypothetical protein